MHATDGHRGQADFDAAGVPLGIREDIFDKSFCHFSRSLILLHGLM
jgi:hypothetical protein